MRLAALLSLVAAAASSSAAVAAEELRPPPRGLETNASAPACPTNGRRIVRLDPSSGRRRAHVVTTNCTAVGASIPVTSNGSLTLRNLALDGVQSYPDAVTLDFAFNRLDSFPADASITAARSLILANNRFRSLADIQMPPNLESLDVQSCAISSGPSSSGAYPLSLVKLRLSGNQLARLDDFVFPPRLRVLEVSDQRLQSFQGATFPSTLETLVAPNTSLTDPNTSVYLPLSLATLDVSWNQLTTTPDWSAFSSLADVNLSFNAIRSIAGVRFPPTLKGLDLRGNPLVELEISRSDVARFQSWSYFLSPLSQSTCRSQNASRVRVRNVELCVLDDAEFDRLYGSPSLVVAPDASSTPVPEENEATRSLPDSSPSLPLSQPADSRHPFTWALVIIAVLVLAVVIIGVVSAFSWRHQQRQRYATMTSERRPTLESDDELLRAVGLYGELKATRLDADEIKILHVLSKRGPSIVYLGGMRIHEATPPPPVANERGKLSLEDLASSRGVRDRRLVTLKRIVPEKGASRSATLRQFIQEIQLLATLEHPRIMSFLGVCWHTLADVTMVFEYLPRGDLKTLLKIESDRVASGRLRRLKWTRPAALSASRIVPSKASIAVAVADALVYLHTRDPPVYHRALRTEHVLFSDRYEAKLCAVGDTLGNNRSATGIAPEIQRGERWTDKADVFAFGVLLAELAGAKVPYDGGARDVDWPVALERLAQRCVHDDPTARPSAHELLNALQRI